VTQIEGTVRLMENWAIIGKLSELNVGQTVDLLREVHEVLGPVGHPKKARAPKVEEPAQAAARPAHIAMVDKEGIPW